MKGLLTTDNSGGAITIILLIILPMLIFTSVYYNEIERLREGADTTLKDAVVFAAKAASQSVDPISQANGDPMIDPDAAHLNFKKILMKNLRLEENMSAISSSPVSGTVSYRLLVCNGQNSFGLPEGVLYIYEEGGLQTIPLSVGNLPQVFDVSLASEEQSGKKTVTLDSPGSIALVSATVRPIATASGTPASRWACAKIISQNRTKREEAR